MIDRRFALLCIGAAVVVLVLLGGATLISFAEERDRAACGADGGVFHEGLCVDPGALIDVGGWIDPEVYVDAEG